MVRISASSTLQTEEKILATVEALNTTLKTSLQEKLLVRLGVNDPYGCNEPENWVKTLKGVTLELKSERSRWSPRELKTLGNLSTYCERWLSAGGM